MAHPQLLGALTTVALVSPGPCTLKALHVFNAAAAAAAYLQLFNTNAAANVTLGTTVPDASFGTAAVTSIAPDLGPGIYFGKGLVAAMATTATGGTPSGTAAIANFVIES